MAKDNSTASVHPAFIAEPTNIEAHNADLQRRRDEHDAKRGVLLDCLDAEVAADYEKKKTLWEWNVEASLFRPTKGKIQAHMERMKKSVVAHNDQDAWAMFCDIIGEWPSRRDSKASIARGKKRTLRGGEEN